MRDDAYDHTFKLLLIGDSGVGKSSILLRFTDGTFDEDIGTTIGVDFKVKVMPFRDQKVKLTIWDTAGQERFRTLTSSYYRGAQGIVLVYDITNPESFENIQQWMNEIEMYTTFPDVVTLLVGNKLDKRQKDGASVPRAKAEAFARQHNMLFIECSAKTKEGVQQTFEELANKILDTPSLLGNTAPMGMNLNKTAADSGSSGCAC
jgi:Ras-related protein Rab-18|eukprot:CAMPEP_0174322000 /NCGR_PEP_ID=MMETSP0810-20121108/10738_1 /TAXON_ID=73025 ORGANISM="Eutreptiella gymnastica-like, Strain CCMP1594" /NCGR_SAMPLE_ID=MMETSP0810 /ASSEMBLY_ACC=CAM_ASM_000659 /LENGTH=204 /DNA_ID=CAMNT_0015433727 /DNA_START=29 /DNA_END=643 /DNA_ORIENTATION=+